MTGPALRVGASRRVITPVAGLSMAGYAARTSTATSTLAELYCRVAVFGDATTTLVLAVCDLLYAPRALTEQVRRQVASALAIPERHVMLCATHTHCGPSDLAVAAGAALRAMIAEQVAVAALEAAARAEPARFVVAQRHVPGVSANRRAAAGTPDDVAAVVAAYPLDAARAPIVTLVNFAAHPTVLGPDTTGYSADFPGAVCDTVEALCGGVGNYLQGCAGDVNPIHARQDPGECLRIGRVIGAAGAQAALDGLGRHLGLRMLSPSWGEEIDAAGRSAADLIAPDSLAAAQRFVDVPAAPAHPVPVGFDTTRARGRAAQRSMRWVQGLRAQGNLFGCFDVPARAHEALEVQHFHLGGGLDLIGIPGEPFQASARTVRAGRGGTVLVAGYANQAAGYLPPAPEFARLGYEVGCCQYEPGAAEAVEATAIGLLGPA